GQSKSADDCAAGAGVPAARVGLGVLAHAAQRNAVIAVRDFMADIFAGASRATPARDRAAQGSENSVGTDRRRSIRLRPIPNSAFGERLSSQRLSFAAAFT